MANKLKAMFKKAAKLAVNLSVMLVTSVYAGYDENMAVINKGMPTPVKQFNKRQIECNHWAGVGMPLLMTAIFSS